MGGSSGGGGSSPSNGGVYITRYASYIETQHKTFLGLIAEYRNSLKDASPFDDYVDIETDIGFFGAGLTLSSYGTLFDNFSTYLVNTSPIDSYTEVFDRIMNSQPVKDSIVAEGKFLSEDIITDAHPRLMVGARDLNAVMSSTFIIAKSNIENQRLRLLGKYSADLKSKLISAIDSVWKISLDWKLQIVNTHMQLIQSYYNLKKANIDYNYMMKAKNILWPFTVLDYERAGLAALQGAQNSAKIAGESSEGGKPSIISGVAGGAALGGMVGGVPGALIGGVVGGIASIF